MVHYITWWLLAWRWLVYYFLSNFSLCTPHYTAGPFVYDVFISVSHFLNVLYNHYFCYRSFDWFQFSPSIAIDYILIFQFDPYSFNFGINLNSLNLFGIEVLFCFSFALRLIDDIFLFSFWFIFFLILGLVLHSLIFCL